MTLIRHPERNAIAASCRPKQLIIAAGIVSRHTHCLRQASSCESRTGGKHSCRRAAGRLRCGRPLGDQVVWSAHKREVAEDETIGRIDVYEPQLRPQLELLGTALGDSPRNQTARDGYC